jgi:glutamyl/glutaminyl-tRNA synthetase
MTWDYVNEDKEAVHVTGFKDANYEPDALINFLALLGWNPGGNKEIMTMDEMISLFELTRINNSGAMFDIEKLKNFNAHYLRNRPSDLLFGNYMLPSIKLITTEAWLDKTYTEVEINEIVTIAKERSIFNTELYKNVSYFFEPVILKDDVVLKNDAEFRKIMSALSGYLKDFDWDHDSIKSVLDELCDAGGFKVGKILPDLRMALTGGIPGPDLPTTMGVLGKDESWKRITALLDKTEKVAS